MRAVLALLGLSLAAASLDLRAQQFQTGVHLVTVPVGVGGKGRVPVAGLTSADFRVLEDGQERTIEAFDGRRAPLSLAVVIDTSGSMTGPRRVLVEESVKQLFERLPLGDEITLVTFASDVYNPVPWIPVSLRVPVPWSYMRPTGGTSLITATRWAVHALDRARSRRRGVLLLSDGWAFVDFGVRAQLRHQLRERQAALYAVATDVPAQFGLPRRPPEANATVLEQLTDSTGGYAHRARSNEGLAAALLAIADELAQEYTIGFAPGALDGREHRLKIESRRRGLELRHPERYTANRPTR